MNMFKATKAKTVKEYLFAVPSERKALVEFLHVFIQKSAPSLKPHFAVNMLGYGSFPYRNAKKEIVQWPTIGLANQKQHVSLYVCSVIDGKYVAESHKKELGKVVVGKSCISIKKLENVHLPTLKKVLKIAERHPGFVGVGATKKQSLKKPKDGSRCSVIAGTHRGKSGVVRDGNVSKTGVVTITVVQEDGERFKTLAKNIVVMA